MAVKNVLLDTNGWFALLNGDDSLHLEAAALWRKLHRENRTVVLTDWIIAETGNGLARTSQRGKFPEAVRRMFLTPRTCFYHTDPHAAGVGAL
jgi:predicted nucleic acid-binding protein